MSETLARIRALVAQEDWRASSHALERLVEHGITPSELADCITTGIAIEDYPSYYAGPCVLMLQSDRAGPVHALWGLEAATDRPAVLITAYRPDPAHWEDDNRTRRS
jgi:hypothetical protein